MRFCFLFLAMVVFSSINAQINPSAIDHIDISYLESNVSDSIYKYKVQANFTFKSDSAISVINFKIMNPDDNSILDDVKYQINSPIVTGVNGEVLFKKENNICYITSISELPLRLYLYQITTEDASGNISEAFIDYK